MLYYLPWEGWTAVSVSGLAGENRIELHTPHLDRETMKRIKPGEPVAGISATHLAPVETNILDKLPGLVAHCAVTRYEDGEPRQPGWVTIKTLGSSWVVQVKDPDSCCSMQAIGGTLDDALILADMLLSSESAPWEPDRFLQGMKGKKTK